MRDLRHMFDPKSVAVVGASNDTSKWGGDVSSRLLRSGRHRAVFLVNRKGGEILGRHAYRSLRELPAPVEMVFLAVPAESFEAVADEALEVGAKALVVITARLGEMSAAGKLVEKNVAARVRAAGAVMIGPNCMGVADTTTRLQGVAYLDLPPGPIGIISQSGGLGEEISLRVVEFGLGFSRFVSLGNQADLGIAETLRSFATHERTDVIIVYAEDLREGRDVARAAREVIAAGKHVVLLAPGRSPASARAASSHTGALTSDTVTVDAACRASGMLRVSTQREAVELAVGLLAGYRPRGRRVAVVSDGGGTGAIAADAAFTAGLVVPAFGPDLEASLRNVLPDNAGGSNPVDFAAATTDPDAYERVIDIIAESGEVDSVIASGVIGFWGARFRGETELVALEAASVQRLADKVRASRLPLIVSTPQMGSPASTDLLSRRVPVYRDIESAVAVLVRLIEAEESPALGVPILPRAVGTRASLEGYWAARLALIDAGIDFPPARLARGIDEAILGAAEVGYPVAIKALGSLHKSDQGGVALNIADESQLLDVATDFQERLGVQSFSVEQMAPLDRGTELIVGCRCDERFGPLLLVGLGGIYAEVMGDVQAALAPVDEDVVRRLLGSLRGAPLLFGARGRSALDVEAVCRAAVVLSTFAATHREVGEVEVNPLLALPTGAVALDARIVRM